ncbi:MAG: MarR family transcriptional regulator [Anaerolineales bacterium]|nr:MarR family transcriptional regulator [Anaerolineales bacterium]
MSNLLDPENLDYLLVQICRLHYTRAHALFEAVGLYRGQPPMLRALWEREGQSHTELAEQLQITPATTTRMIQRMEKAGFVQRQPDPADQRLSRVYLTDAGRAVRAEVDALHARMEAETFAGLTPEQQEVLRACFQQMRANLQAVST